jgi:hypothetical protein
MPRNLAFTLAILTLTVWSREAAAGRFTDPPEATPSYTVRHVNHGVTVDGIVAETDWERTPALYLRQPWSDPGSDAGQRTQVRMLWGASGL